MISINNASYSNDLKISGNYNTIIEVSSNSSMKFVHQPNALFKINVPEGKTCTGKRYTIREFSYISGTYSYEFIPGTIDGTITANTYSFYS